VLEQKESINQICLNDTKGNEKMPTFPSRFANQKQYDKQQLRMSSKDRVQPIASILHGQR